MTNSLKCYEYSGGSECQGRVSYFMVKAAIAVMSEDAGTANHAERVILARAILDGSASVFRYSLAVAANATIAANIILDQPIPDSDIEFTVNSLFTAFSL